MTIQQGQISGVLQWPSRAIGQVCREIRRSSLVIRITWYRNRDNDGAAHERVHMQPLLAADHDLKGGGFRGSAQGARETTEVDGGRVAMPFVV